MSGEFAVKSGAGAIVLSNRTWSTGEKMVPTLGDASANSNTARKWVWECTTGGTTNGTPTWNAAPTQDVTTVTQNSTVFTARKPGYSTGSTFNWAFATIFLHYGALAMSAGDTLYVSSNHSENNANFAGTIAFPGTLASPNYIYSVNDGASPPTARLAGATVNYSAASTMSINGRIYCFGINFINGSGGTGGNMTLGGQSLSVEQIYETCTFQLLSTNAAGNSLIMSASGTTFAQRRTLIDCQFKMGVGASRINCNRGIIEWRSCGWMAAGTSPTVMLSGSTADTPMYLVVNGFDGTNLGSSFSWMVSTDISGTTIIIKGFKPPSSWTGSFFSAAPTNAGVRATAYQYGLTSANYAFYDEDCYGVMVSDATVSCQSTNGTTPLSYKATANANAWFLAGGFVSQQFNVWNELTASSKNVTIEVIATNTGAGTSGIRTNKQLNMRVGYSGDSGSPLISYAYNTMQDIFATPADVTSSTTAWTCSTTRGNSTAYATGDVIKSTNNVGRLFYVSSGGTTAGSEPSDYASATDGTAGFADGSATVSCMVRQKLVVAVTPQLKGDVLANFEITPNSALGPVWFDGSYLTVT